MVGEVRRIALRRTGGLAAAMRPLEVEVDLASKDPEVAALAGLVRELDVAGLAGRGATPPGAVADGFRYELTVEDDDGRHRLDFAQGDMPAGLGPVVKDLERRGLEQLRSRRRR